MTRLSLEKVTKSIGPIGKALALGEALASMPPSAQQAVKSAVEEQARREREAIQAAALGVTIEEYRVIQSLPADWIDWTKVGNR